MGSAASLDPMFATCGIDQYAAHGLGGGSEELLMIRPAGFIGRSNQFEKSFMDESRRLKGVAGRLRGQAGGSKFAKLVVDERQKISGSLVIPGSRFIEESFEFSHISTEFTRFLVCIQIVNHERSIEHSHEFKNSR
jgi:hypothetical protein